MTASDPGLADRIAAAILAHLRATPYGDPHQLAEAVVPLVEQHINGRMAELEAEKAADEMQIQSFDVKDGVMNLKMSPGGNDSEGVLLAMADAMGELLDKHDATNYVEFDLHKRGRSAFSVCVRRFHRPTPHDLRMQAETRAEKAETKVSETREGLSQLMDKLTTTAEGLGDWHDATEYIEWAREKVREIYVAAALEREHQ